MFLSDEGASLDDATVAFTYATVEGERMCEAGMADAGDRDLIAGSLGIDDPGELDSLRLVCDALRGGDLELARERLYWFNVATHARRTLEATVHGVSVRL